MRGTQTNPVVFSLFLLAIVLARPASAQDYPLLVGDWDGAIQVQGISLQIQATFTLEPPDVVTGFIDIPQQQARGLRLRFLNVEGDRVTFEFLTGTDSAVFDGRLDGDRIAGSFRQGRATGTFTLERQPAAAEAEPLPYAAEEIVVDHDAVRLAGTLTIPAGVGPFPALVLISGSGAQNRDEDIFGFKIFQVIADHLTRRGVAVFRYDDRGVGGSTGNVAFATTEDSAGDVGAIIEQLAQHAAIDAARIGLLGHSEGAAVASIVAARSSAVRAVILMAGTGVRGDAVLRQQAADGARSVGATEDQVTMIVAAHQAATDAVLSGAPAEAVSDAVRALMRAQLEGRPAVQRAAIGDIDAFIEQRLGAAVGSLNVPWMRFMLGFDPATVLVDVRCPVLALFGGKDMQVPPSLNRPPVEAALAGNPAVTVIEYPDANHLFQRAVTGLVTEYATLDKAFAGSFLDDIEGWIRGALAR